MKQTKYILSVFLILPILLCSCSQKVNDIYGEESLQYDNKTKEQEVIFESDIPEEERGDDSEYEYSPEFDNLGDTDLLRYMEDDIYSGLIEELADSDYYVENVQAVYVSKEYLEEVAYNSQSNIFFGYTLEEIQNVYGDTKYVFTLSDNGETIVEPFEDYDDTFDQIIKNVAIGTGVILVCVTVSSITAGIGAPAVSLIFAASAKTGTVMALSSGTISGVASGMITGVKTGNIREAAKAGALAGSNNFKWGAVAGALAGGAGEAIALKGATLNGLSMNEAALIQKETGFPLDVIRQFHSKEEYEVLKAAGLKAQMVNGKIALIRNDINLNLLDEFGRSNLKRMQLGLSPLDSAGNTYELHHIGQRADATLAVLTQAEHDNAALHGFKAISEIDRVAFAKQRTQFWKTMASMLEKGVG